MSCRLVVHEGQNPIQGIKKQNKITFVIRLAVSKNGQNFGRKFDFIPEHCNLAKK